MNGIPSTWRVLLVAGFMLTAAACADSGLTEVVIDDPEEIDDPIEEEPQPPPPLLTESEAQISDASSAFGFDLLRQVHAEAEEANVLLSPLSASMALGMALNGAHGETYDAMHAALGFTGMSEAEVNQAYRGLMDALQDVDPEVGFRLANSAWAREGVAFEEAFLDAAATHFDSELHVLDFLDPASPAVIDQWVDEITGGRIQEIVEVIDPRDILFLINAVYFKAGWSRGFIENETSPRPFHTLDGGSVEVPTMVREDGGGRTLLFEDDEVSVVDLPYADSVFSMTLVLPAEGRTLDQTIESLTPERWHAWTGDLEQDAIRLLLPKFRFEFDIQLEDALTALGMGIAFDEFRADFRRITTSLPGVHIDEVYQKTFIDVHESGTEAAGVTSVRIQFIAAGWREQLHFDRPFLFAIRERESNTLLFLGTVGDPSAS